MSNGSYIVQPPLPPLHLSQIVPSAQSPPPPIPINQPIPNQTLPTLPIGPTRYTLEEITPLIKTIMEQLIEAQSVAFNITALDDDDDDDDMEDEEEFEDVVTLEDLRNHTKIVVVQVIPAEHNMCAVCHEEYQANDVLRELRCQHKFHQACVDRVLENAVTCPMCRMHVVPDDDDSEEASSTSDST